MRDSHTAPVPGLAGRDLPSDIVTFLLDSRAEATRLLFIGRYV